MMICREEVIIKVFALQHKDCRTLYSLRKLQSVQNATARLITGTRRRDHITPVLRELHWLPIRECVRFKVASLVRQSLSGQAPLYLTDDCCLVSDSTRRSLRSADVPTCVVPRAVTATDLLQPLGLACGTLFRSSCAIQTSPTDCSDDSTFSGKHEHGALWLLICGALEKNTYVLAFLLTLLTYCSEHRKATEEVGKEQLRKRHGVRNVFSRFEVQLVEDEGGSTGKRWM